MRIRFVAPAVLAALTGLLMAAPLPSQAAAPNPSPDSLSKGGCSSSGQQDRQRVRTCERQRHLRRRRRMSAACRRSPRLPGSQPREHDDDQDRLPPPNRRSRHERKSSRRAPLVQMPDPEPLRIDRGRGPGHAPRKDEGTRRPARSGFRARTRLPNLLPGSRRLDSIGGDGRNQQMHRPPDGDAPESRRRRALGAGGRLQYGAGPLPPDLQMTAYAPLLPMLWNRRRSR